MFDYRYVVATGNCLGSLVANPLNGCGEGKTCFTEVVYRVLMHKKLAVPVIDLTVATILAHAVCACQDAFQILERPLRRSTTGGVQCNAVSLLVKLCSVGSVGIGGSLSRLFGRAGKSGFGEVDCHFTSVQGECLAVFPNDGCQHVTERHASTTFRTMSLLFDLLAVVVDLFGCDSVFVAQFEELFEVEPLNGGALLFDENSKRIFAAVLIPARILGRHDGLGDFGFVAHCDLILLNPGLLALIAPS